MNKKVIVCGGGTGGHVFPAISIANALRRLAPEVDILFVGAEGKMEMEKVPEAGYKIIGLPVKGFRRSLTFSNIRVLLDLFRSLRRAKTIVKDFKPDVVVGVGGYASGPVGMVAAKMGIPLILQEQNSFPGVTNRFLSKKAMKICVAYDGMERFFEQDKIIKTGNPVRKDLLDSVSRRSDGITFYGLDESRKTVLITGGSLGAETINNAVVNSLSDIANWSDVQIVWQCGSRYYDKLSAELDGKLPKNVKIVPFLKRMDLAYAVADIVVARAGASTVSELCLLKKATILIPSPNVAEDHQTKNARALSDKGAAIMLSDADAELGLCRVLKELSSDAEKIRALQNKIVDFAVRDSDEIIAKHVLNV